MLFYDHPKVKGVLILLDQILRMRVERVKLPKAVVYFESKIQSSKLPIPGGRKFWQSLWSPKGKRGWGEDGYHLHETLFSEHQGLEVLLTLWSSEAHTFVVAQGEFTPTLEHMGLLTLIDLFDKATAMGIVLEEKDKVK